MCPRCEIRERAPSKDYCAICHARYMRQWRKTHPQSEEARRRGICRAYANVYLQRGKLTKQTCEVCGNPKVRMRHDDYSKPLQVRWLCDEHHSKDRRAA